MDDRDYKILSDRIDKVECRVDKMDNEVDNLKMSNMEIKTKLTSLELSLEQVKTMISQTSNDNQKLTMQLIEVIKSDKESDNKRAMTNTEKLWATILAIVGGLLAYFGLK